MRIYSGRVGVETDDGEGGRGEKVVGGGALLARETRSG